MHDAGENEYPCELCGVRVYDKHLAAPHNGRLQPRVLHVRSSSHSRDEHLRTTRPVTNSSFSGEQHRPLNEAKANTEACNAPDSKFKFKFH